VTHVKQLRRLRWWCRCGVRAAHAVKRNCGLKPCVPRVLSVQTTTVKDEPENDVYRKSTFAKRRMFETTTRF
jgi:hypothetical protein